MVFHKKKRVRHTIKMPQASERHQDSVRGSTTRKHQKEDKDDTNCTTGAAPEYVHLKQVCSHRAHRQSPVWA